MTDWTPRTLDVDLSFLGTGKFKAEIYKDGINADAYAADYKKELQEFTAKTKLQIKMAPGGGWVARIREL
jgi:alpha-glucosidase